MYEYEFDLESNVVTRWDGKNKTVFNDCTVYSYKEFRCVPKGIAMFGMKDGHYYADDNDLDWRGHYYSMNYPWVWYMYRWFSGYKDPKH